MLSHIIINILSFIGFSAFCWLIRLAAATPPPAITLAAIFRFLLSFLRRLTLSSATMNIAAAFAFHAFHVFFAIFSFQISRDYFRFAFAIFMLYFRWPLAIAAITLFQPLRFAFAIFDIVFR
jgi:hypothetical protein